MASSLVEEAHAAVGSLVHKTQELASVLLQLRQQPDASDELASKARALNAECEQHWAIIASAAASVDASGASQARGSSGDEAGEIAALEQQRHELHEVCEMPCRPPPTPVRFACMLDTRCVACGQAVGAQNDVLKQQIDMLRRMFCDVQLMGGAEDALAEAPG